MDIAAIAIFVDAKTCCNDIFVIQRAATMIAVLVKRHLGKTNKTVKYRKISVINGKILLILMFAEMFTPHKHFVDT